MKKFQTPICKLHFSTCSISGLSHGWLFFTDSTVLYFGYIRVYDMGRSFPLGQHVIVGTGCKSRDVKGFLDGNVFLDGLVTIVLLIVGEPYDMQGTIITLC